MHPQEYTFKVYVKDGRRKTGERLIDQKDMIMADVTPEEYVEEVRKINPRITRVEVNKTWVERTNALSGKTFWERYDTPFHCSPSSEAYFSM